MFNGHTRIVHGSIESGSFCPSVTLHAVCGQGELAFSYAFRLERSSFLTGRGASSHVGNYHARHGFHTSSSLPLTKGQPLYVPTSGLSKKPPSLPSPEALHHPGPKPSVPARHDRGHRSPQPKPLPPSGNKRRVGNVQDDTLSLPRSPVQEIERRTVVELQELTKKRELALREAARQAARARKFQRACHLSQSLERIDQDTIAAQLVATRRRAKRRYLELWTKKHVLALTAPVVLGLDRLASRTLAVDRQIKQLRSDIQEFKASLLRRAESAEWELEFVKKPGSIDYLLRESGNSNRESVVDALSDATLAAITHDLLERGLWTPYNKPSSASVLDFSPRGASSVRVRRAMLGILWVRAEIDETTEMISKSLHLLRRIRMTRLLYSTLPEVFHFYVRELPFYIHIHEINNSAQEVSTLLRHLRTMINLSSTYTGRSPTRYNHPRLKYIYRQAAHVTSSIQSEWRDGVAPLQALGMKSDLALQDAQLSNFRPFSVFISRYRSLLTLTQDLMRYCGRSQYGRTRFAALIAWQKELKADRRDLWKAWTLALLWRTTADMYYGTIRSPRSSSAFMTSVDSVPAALDVPRPVQGDGVSVAAPQIPPWLRPANLYPQEGSIPIHFVTTAEHAYIVSQRLSGYKVLGMDIVTSPASKLVAGSGVSLIDFLILASGHEVAIFQLGAMSLSRLADCQAFQQTLANPSILKVGVNADFQRSMLATQFGFHLDGCCELETRETKPRPYKDMKDPNRAVLSALASKSLGGGLPELNILRARQEIGTKDPSLFFIGLASRGYAALQLHHIASSAETSPPPTSSFGPVLVYHTASLGSSHYQLLGPSRPRSRAAYMQSLAYAMARKVLEDHSFFHVLKRVSRRQRPILMRETLKSLEAYCLFTSFNEKLETIRSILRIPNPAATILQLVDKAHLPLLERDRELLETGMGFASVDVLEAWPAEPESKAVSRTHKARTAHDGPQAPTVPFVPVTVLTRRAHKAPHAHRDARKIVAAASRPVKVSFDTRRTGPYPAAAQGTPPHRRRRQGGSLRLRESMVHEGSMD